MPQEQAASPLCSSVPTSPHGQSHPATSSHLVLLCNNSFPQSAAFLSQQPEKLCSLHNVEHLSVSTALWQWYLHLTAFLNRAERHFDTAGGLGQQGKSGIISTEGTWSNYLKWKECRREGKVHNLCANLCNQTVLLLWVWNVLSFVSNFSNTGICSLKK